MISGFCSEAVVHFWVGYASVGKNRSRVGELLFREQIGGVRLASSIPAHLDLLRGDGLAKEMAEQLGNEGIGF